MRLSRDTRYALEALSVLARRPRGTVVEAREVAEEAGLPGPFLAKILQRLAAAGVLDSRRGRGYALLRPAEAVSLREVIAAVEPHDASWDGCIFWREECSESEPCPLHFRWRELKPSFEEAMGSITLAEVRDHGVRVLDGAAGRGGGGRRATTTSAAPRPAHGRC